MSHSSRRAGVPGDIEGKLKSLLFQRGQSGDLRLDTIVELRDGEGGRGPETDPVDQQRDGREVSRFDEVDALENFVSRWNHSDGVTTGQCRDESAGLSTREGQNKRLRRAGEGQGEGERTDKSKDMRPGNEVHVVVFLCSFLETEHFLRRGEGQTAEAIRTA